MTVLSQRIYAAILNTIYRHITSRIPERVRNALILFVFMVFFIYFVIFRSAEHYQFLLKKLSIIHCVGGAMLFVVAVLSVNRELQPVKYHKLMSVPYVLLGAGFVITRIMHPIGAGYLVFGLMLLTVYPCLYFVWNNRRDYEVLFDRIAAASVIAELFYFVYYFYLYVTNPAPPEGMREAANMYNANFFAFLGVSLACSALYLWYRSFRKEVGYRHVIAVYSLISFTVGSFLTVVGGSRSSLIIIAASFFVLLVFVFKNSTDGSDSRTGKLKSRLAVLLIAVAILGGLYVASESGGISLLSRFSPENMTADQFSSGRISLWQSYAQNLNITGHDMTQVDWNTLTVGINTRHAHNTFLDFSYRCGIPVGIAFILFHFAAGVMSLVMLFKKRKNRSYELFVVICVVHFTVHSLIDIATVPLGSYGAFFFYIAVAPIFVFEDNSDYAGRH